MGKKNSKLQLAQNEAQKSVNETNKLIDELGGYTGNLYNSLNEIQRIFDLIRNVPNEQRLQYENLKKIRLNWKQQADKIETDYQNSVVKNAGRGAAGVGAGVAVAALGPTAAMGIATTFGVASTGTAISALSGAAATNAALAWLGGGALAAGGGGMAAGHALLALAGPIGWAIAGVAIAGSGLMFWKAKKEQQRLEDIFTLISKRDIKSYSLANVELKERINRIFTENRMLVDAINRIRYFGTDYLRMTESQQYELGSYVNLMSSSTQLLVLPILGLQPKYNETDYNAFLYARKNSSDYYKITSDKNIIISLANLFYTIKMDDKDRKLVHKSFKKNKKFLESMNIKKNNFDESVIELTYQALNYKYRAFNIKF